MLTSIITTNFKKLSSHAFGFTDGLNIICGDNFRGKTTLTQAIAFALFGVRVIPGAADKIPTWGEKDCKVEMIIGEYKITRTIKNCTILKAGDPEATGTEPCNDYIEKHITGVDYKGFQILNWSAQGETAALLTMGAAQLQRDVEKFSGVAFIDEMLKLAGVDLRDVSRDTKLFETRGSQKDIEAKIAKSEKGIAGFLKTKASLEGVIEIEDTQKTRVEELLESGEATNRKCATNQVIISTLTSQIKSAKLDVTRMEESRTVLEASMKEAESLTREGYELRKEGLKLVEKTNNMVENYTEESDKIEVTLDRIEEKIKEDERLLNEVEGCTVRRNSCKDEVEVAQYDVNYAQQKVEDLQKVVDSGVCSACGQNIHWKTDKRA